jgi:hypothetical protein
MLSKNDDELTIGRYGIVIRSERPSGAFIHNLLEQKRRHQRGVSERK